MQFELNAEQESLRETTARFLSKRVPAGEVRRLRDDPDGFGRDYWRRGAELGWTSLLAGEDLGGGSVSGNGLVDLTLIAHEFGRRAAPGPLLSANVAVVALGSDRHDDREKALAGLISGETLTACSLESPRGRGAPALEVRVDGDDLVLSGALAPVEHAAQSDFLLVTGRSETGLTQVLVPNDLPGVAFTPMGSLDLTRRYSTVEFDRARVPSAYVVGEIGSAGAQVEHQLQVGTVILVAEMVGAMERSFEMTLEWAFDRYSFGRPLASYQELKHRFADMKSWLEASHAICDAAAGAVGSRGDDAQELVSVAKAYVGHYGAELVQDCVQIHGGIGVTFDHDLHLFLRRTALDRNLLGSPADHRQRVAHMAIERALASVPEGGHGG